MAGYRDIVKYYDLVGDMVHNGMTEGEKLEAKQKHKNCVSRHRDAVGIHTHLRLDSMPMVTLSPFIATSGPDLPPLHNTGTQGLKTSRIID